MKNCLRTTSSSPLVNLFVYNVWKIPRNVPAFADSIVSNVTVAYFSCPVRS